MTAPESTFERSRRRCGSPRRLTLLPRRREAIAAAAAGPARLASPELAG